MAALSSIVAWLDRTLRTREVADYDGARNGLQIQNSGAVKKIGAAVDACEPVLDEAAARGVSLLLVHHGLFWGGVQPVVGAVYRKMRTALAHDLALYSSHLPLDLHPTLGNTALLCRALDFKRCAPFFVAKGQTIGLQTRAALPLAEVARRLERVLGSAPHICAGGPARTQRIGVVTGAAGAEVAQAAEAGVDTFITGEGPHYSYPLAEELGVNLLYSGHYATETFGVKALAAAAAKKFRVPWEFIDHPTGL
jgi:dinuclear metal center YbgI/SA1388 family protein